MTAGPVDGGAVVFLHIPKTGGTTMSRILERQYRLRESFWTEWDRQSLRSFRNLPEKQRARIRLLYGHLAFGVHEVLPRPARYLTLLRDPIERAVSHYYFIRRTSRHPLHERVVSREMTLVDYVKNPIANELVNGQTRLIAGVVDGSARDSENPALLETAKRNIRGHFGLVGLAERFDESLLLAKEIFGWTRPVHYIRRNVTLRRPSLEDIPRDAVNLIRERNRLDMELYRIAKERLEVEVDRRGSEFRRQLCAFRLDNFPGPLTRLKTLLPHGALRPVLTLGQRMVRGF